MLYFKNIWQNRDYNSAPCSLVQRLKPVLLHCETFYRNIKVKGGKFPQQNKSHPSLFVTICDDPGVSSIENTIPKA